ncbi:hypothetical protein A2U01_0063578, partial [Trifolium medium]|nr:hypothetical protein [Trifolium medium]
MEVGGEGLGIGHLNAGLTVTFTMLINLPSLSLLPIFQRIARWRSFGRPLQ